MAIEEGCVALTTQNIASGSLTIAVKHTSVYGEATCQTQKAASGIFVKARLPNPNPRRQAIPKVTVENGDLEISTMGLNAGERVCWLSDDGL